jgi:hypothetical protein
VLLIINSTQVDDLFICDACDAEGVPDLVRNSGRHTEEHHLIRCLAPEIEEEKVSPTEHRLSLIEGRLDDITGSIADLNARIGILEKLLHRLAGATTPGGAT